MDLPEGLGVRVTAEVHHVLKLKQQCREIPRHELKQHLILTDQLFGQKISLQFALQRLVTHISAQMQNEKSNSLKTKSFFDLILKSAS